MPHRARSCCTPVAGAGRIVVLARATDPFSLTVDNAAGIIETR